MIKAKFFIVIFVFTTLNLLAQIDANKRYIALLYVKPDTALKNVTISLLNKTSELKYTTDTIRNLAFFYEDTVSLKITTDSLNLEIKNLSEFLTYTDFAYAIEIKLCEIKTACTQISVLDGRVEEEYGVILNCPDDEDNLFGKINLLYIWTYTKINPNPNTYKTLQP
ncbi:MAG TPA: hypothetical protein VKG26_08955 [Bacteroidia bacterium]|nr:hypothetical protein [Bacteroidia bacterium]